MGAVANGGVLWKPRLVQRVERADGALAYSASSKMTGRVELSPVVWAFLRQALSAVVNEAAPARRRAHPRPRRRGQDRHRADHRQERRPPRGRTTPGSPRSRPRDDPRWSWSCSSSEAARAAQVAAPSRGRSTRPSSSRRSRRSTLGGVRLMLRLDRRLLQNVDWPLLGAALVRSSWLSLVWPVRASVRGRRLASLVWRQLCLGRRGLIGPRGRGQRRLPEPRAGRAGSLRARAWACS